LTLATDNTWLWDSGTSAPTGTILYMLSGGNLVIRTPAGKDIWATGTGGNPGAFVRVTDDGKGQVVTKSGAVLWSVPTAKDASRGDDYPWRTADPNQLSSLGFNYRNCTDFVAWRLNRQMGITSEPWAFKWGSMRWPAGGGHAINWKSGVEMTYGASAVNATPTAGSVAWWGASRGGGLGHVAIVTRTNSDGSVDVEEYNVVPNTFGVTRATRAEAYLHVADI
jgi:surface antigen